ncbi:unnamed protein product [Symbiodinium natans]|uniref:Uncharacterized protein n=1 Tax=Symbiodinium natans TaxID=878477 RepID=A0A812M294_9DINO|nr:unnamed protein product [Symbiodinium natans]
MGKAKPQHGWASSNESASKAALPSSFPDVDRYESAAASAASLVETRKTATAAIDSSETAVDLIPLPNIIPSNDFMPGIDTSFSSRCDPWNPSVKFDKEGFTADFKHLQCWVTIFGSEHRIIDFNMGKTVIDIGKIGADIIKNVPPLNFLAQMDKIMVEFFQVFAKISSSMAKAGTRGSTSLIQAVAGSDFPAVGAVPVLHHSSNGFQIHTHAQHVHRQHAVFMLQEGSGDPPKEPPPPNGMLTAGFGAIDQSYRSKLITQFGGREGDTMSCLAFAPRTKSGSNNQATKADWQATDTEGFIQLEPWAVPCSPQFLRDKWDKWQGYSVYGWNLPVEKCLTVSFGIEFQPVIAFVGGISIKALKDMCSVSVSICWPDFMPGGLQLSSISIQFKVFNTLLFSVTTRLVKRFGTPTDFVPGNIDASVGTPFLPVGMPRPDWMNSRGLEMMKRSPGASDSTFSMPPNTPGYGWGAYGTGGALLENRSATHPRNIPQRDSDDTEWAIQAEDLYLASMEMGDDMNITQTSEFRGEEVLKRMKAMSALQNDASSSTGANYHRLFKFMNSGLVGFDLEGVLEGTNLDMIVGFKFGEFGAQSQKLRLFDTASQVGDIIGSTGNMPAGDRDKAGPCAIWRAAMS